MVEYIPQLLTYFFPIIMLVVVLVDTNYEKEKAMWSFSQTESDKKFNEVWPRLGYT